MQLIYFCSALYKIYYTLCLFDDFTKLVENFSRNFKPYNSTPLVKMPDFRHFNLNNDISLLYSIRHKRKKPFFSTKGNNEKIVRQILSNFASQKIPVLCGKLTLCFLLCGIFAKNFTVVNLVKMTNLQGFSRNMLFFCGKFSEFTRFFSIIKPENVKLFKIQTILVYITECLSECFLKTNHRIRCI